MNTGRKKIKVLIIDDSALVRDILKKGLSADPSIEIVGAAPDVYIGRDMIVKYRPDVLTLDVEMPRMDGIEFLRKLMPQFPLPVVVVSSLTQKGKQITLDALDAGALDFVPKPSSNIREGLKSMIMELRTKIKIASTANVSHWKGKRLNARRTYKTIKTNALAETTDKVIAIGASTGGTEALKKVVTKFPRNMPGVVIVQHMPTVFTKMFAERLNQICDMEVKEAETNDRIMTGRILVAPGDFHLRVIRSGGIYKAVCEQTPKVSGHRPSVDVLFQSVAKNVGSNAFGIILTGMGSDGAKGMKMMKDAGASNIAQDEATSVVYGMPKVAKDMGGVDYILSIDKIAEKTIEIVSNSS